ncbi:MAG TPA: hypothetical protein G4O06_06775 [Dehalococcoidia bacterium]|jgi:hypothetical protein|nr:hypothetical protein [Dehalococcoidia bacterium]
MSDIKSAREIAMEKIEKLGKATDEERLKWKYIPEGEKLAARYLKQDCNLVVELSRYQENVTKYIIEGAEDILIRNINLPKDDLAKRKNRQAMDGLKTLKSDKIGVENVYSKLRSIFQHYREQGEQQRKQAYESLKAEFEARIQEAVQQQLGSLAGIRVDVERQPQFQEEWRKIQAQLGSQYVMLLDEYKRELSAIH